MVNLCSKCSAKVRPIVAVDIDGTIAEYHLHLANHIEKYWGLEGSIWHPWDGNGNYEDYFGITQAKYREAKLAFRQGGYKRWSPPMFGLLNLRNTLSHLRKQVGLEVWITTTRPWNRLDSTDPDTRFWLDKNFPVYDHLLYHDHKYQELASILEGNIGRVVAVIEDLPDMWQEAAHSFGWGRSFLVERPHNEYFRTTSLDQVNATPDLQAFAHVLLMMTDEWMMNNG